ncbi:hypothetical protein MN116_005845 [Schistosoma mekongi]|uniref:Centriolar satellite-associated tubulin polyglutamylase complex regulator 1 n=1 Tax=Schistosoma mekongi TaxID=38744 RepID=A0AAE2D3X4_SCHME|nr:hypothetical protein MN116_005845 [Schistosoma mekongi]
MSLSKCSNHFLDDLPIHRFSECDLNIYFQDIVNQLLHIRQSGERINIKLFLSKYFEHVINGTHTILREFRYVSAIPYNRITFLLNLWTAFASFNDKGLTIEEFYTIVQLFCSDIPSEIFSYCQKTLKIVYKTTIVYPYKELFCVFQFHFYFNEFVSVLISEPTKSDKVVNANIVGLDDINNGLSEMVGKSGVSNRDTEGSQISVASECCFKRRVVINLPDKYVDSIDFLNFTRDLYSKSTLLLPPKSVMRKCAKTYLLHSRFNLYGLFSSLATDHLLIKELGFPQISGSSTS